jgi:hypothetical protein
MKTTKRALGARNPLIKPEERLFGHVLLGCGFAPMLKA